MKPDSPYRQYYPVLDGVRGFAILLVIFYHNFGFINYFFFGWLGVDLFFVLSGYLITDILLKTFGSKNWLRNFYIRRMLRIFPMYYLALFIFLVILPHFPKNSLQLGYFVNNQWWLWFYLQNWLYIFKNVPHANTLDHLWSLAVEEQFYILWPLAILFLKIPKHLFWVISFLLFLVLIFRFLLWTLKIENLAYFNLYTFTRIDGICIGCMLSLLHRINFNFLKKYTYVIVLGLAGLNFLFYFFNSLYHFTFPYLAIVGYTTFAVMFGLLIHEAITKDSKLINVIFTTGILKFFGKISYSLYLFHWPLYLLILPHFVPWARQNIPGFSPQLGGSIVATLVAVGVAFLSYRYFESFFLKIKKRFEPRPLRKANGT